MKAELTEFIAKADLDSLDYSIECGSCQTCCISAEGVQLTEGEVKEFPSYLDINGKPRMKTSHGQCVHLYERGCSIYEKRPIACRKFDCRAFALTAKESQLYTPAHFEAFEEGSRRLKMFNKQVELSLIKGNA